MKINNLCREDINGEYSVDSKKQTITRLSDGKELCINIHVIPAEWRPDLGYTHVVLSDDITQTQYGSPSVLFFERSLRLIGTALGDHGGLVFEKPNGGFIEECPGKYNWVSTGSKYRSISIDQVKLNS